ncbi:MAG: hypothetical protein K2W82_19725 [Candidatus Obscuribacterales bacterium]|nr:hypothetical protein [Candidatus Obscuribacterales bacterium]
MRKKSGQQLVEVAIGLMALVPIFLFLYDICVVFLVTNLNDGVARDAARAASATEPVGLPGVGTFALTAAAQNFDRANRVVGLAQRRAGGYITNIRIDPNVNWSSINVLNAPDPFMGGLYNGDVRVRTIVTFNIPVTFGFLPAQQTFNADARFPLTAQRTGTARQSVN